MGLGHKQTSRGFIAAGCLYDLEEDKKSIICTIVINILKLFIHIFVNF